MLKVGFCQFDPRFGDVAGNLDRIESLLADCDADLVVLPELADTGYNFESPGELADLATSIPDGQTVERLAELARAGKRHIVAGLAERASSGGGDVFYNSAVLVSPSGYVGTYRKLHLFDRETLYFQRGDLGFPVFELEAPGRPKIGMMICFDWRYPEAARSLALAGADIIAHPANLVMSYCQDAMVTRCLENRVFAVTANRTGVEDRGGVRIEFTGRSQIMGPDGRTLATAGVDDERVAVVAIDPNEARDKSINERNNLFEDRRTAYYRG